MRGRVQEASGHGQGSLHMCTKVGTLCSHTKLQVTGIAQRQSSSATQMSPLFFFFLLSTIESFITMASTEDTVHNSAEGGFSEAQLTAIAGIVRDVLKEALGSRTPGTVDRGAGDVSEQSRNGVADPDSFGTVWRVSGTTG